MRFGKNGEWAQPRMLAVQYGGITGNDLDQWRKPGARHGARTRGRTRPGDVGALPDARTDAQVIGEPARDPPVSFAWTFTALVLNAVIAGLLLGGFYAAVSVGISISFGMLDVVNIAHPAFIILGSYVAYIVNDRLRLRPDPGVARPVAALLRCSGWRSTASTTCASRSAGRSRCAGSRFFFGILFITEVALVLVFGVDYRIGAARPTPTTTWRLGRSTSRCGWWCRSWCRSRWSSACSSSSRTPSSGARCSRSRRTQLALRLMGVDPVRVKELAFALSIATAGVAGAFLIVIQPVQPAIGREYIGLVFAVCVLGGMGSIWGTLVGALVLGARRVVHLHVLRTVVGARRFPSGPAAADAGVQALGTLRPMSNRVFAVVAFAFAARHRSRRASSSPNDYFFSAAYTRAAVRDPRDRLEHPRRLHRLRELRLGGVLRDRRLHARCSLYKRAASRRSS